MESIGSSEPPPGPSSSRSFFLVATSHSSTRPSPPAIASVRPSGLKSTLCQPPCDDRSGGPTGRHVAVSQSVVPSCVTVACELAVGTERRRVDGRVESLEPRADPRAVLERAEERAAGVDRVVEAAGLECEEERQVGMLRRDLARLRGEASGLGDGRRVPRASTLRPARTTPRSPPPRARPRRRRAGRADVGRGAARSQLAVCASRLASRNSRSTRESCRSSPASSTAAASRGPR